MKETLIKLLKKVDLNTACEKAFDNTCCGIDCSDCPFYTENNMSKLISELEN